MYSTSLGLHAESENDKPKPYIAPVDYTTPIPEAEMDAHAESEPENHFENSVDMQHQGLGHSHDDECVHGCDIPDPTRFIKGLL